MAVKPPVGFLAAILLLGAGCMLDDGEPDSEAGAPESVEQPVWISYLEEGKTEWKDAQVVERLWPTTIDEMQHVLAREAPAFMDGMMCRSEDRFQLFGADLRGVGKEDIIVLRERTSWYPVYDEERFPVEESCLLCLERTNAGPIVLWRQVLVSVEEIDNILEVKFQQLDADPGVEITACYGYRDVRRIRVVEWDGQSLQTRDLSAEYAYDFADVDDDGVVEVLVRGDFMGDRMSGCCENAKRWWYDVCSYENGKMRNVNDRSLKWFKTQMEKERAKISRLREMAESDGGDGSWQFSYEISACEEIIARCKQLISNRDAD